MVDAEGKLYSVEARGKLEEMIPELLKKSDSPRRCRGSAANDARPKVIRLELERIALRRRRIRPGERA